MAAAEPTKVAIGYPPATDFLAAYVAKEQGIFAKHNIDATLVEDSRRQQYSIGGRLGQHPNRNDDHPVVLQADDGGLDLVLVAGAARHTKEHPFISLMARSDIKYAKPADLIGKTVGVPGINSVIDVMFRKWLLNNHVPLDKVKVVEGPLPQLPDMLKSGSIDYVCIVDPLRTRIVATKIGYLAAEYFAEVNPDVLVSGWLASGDWAKKNPEAVKGFRLSIDEGLDFIRKNPERRQGHREKIYRLQLSELSDLQQQSATGRSHLLSECRKGTEAVPHPTRSEEDRAAIVESEGLSHARSHAGDAAGCG